MPVLLSGLSLASNNTMKSNDAWCLPSPELRLESEIKRSNKGCGGRATLRPAYRAKSVLRSLFETACVIMLLSNDVG